MGIKPKYIKDIGQTLVERYPRAFNDDFEHNKEMVAELTTIDSKMVRNRVAGYTTRLKVLEHQQRIALEQADSDE